MITGPKKVYIAFIDLSKNEANKILLDFKSRLDENLSDFITKVIAMDRDKDTMERNQSQIIWKVDRVLWNYQCISYYPSDLNDPEDFRITL